MKDVRRHRKRNVRGHKKSAVYSAVILGTVVFCLVVLPLLLILVVGDDGGRWGTPGEAPHQPVTVFRHVSGKTATLDLEDYVAGVVAGEMPATFEMEALKAQAVAARTYALSKMTRAETGGNPADHPEAPLCDDTHCQVYRDEAELLELKGDNWMKDGWVKIQEAVLATAGQVMYFDGALVEQPLFHSASGGRTENSEDVFVSALPYLRSVDSLYEGAAPYQNETVAVSLGTFAQKVSDTFGATGITANTIQIMSRSEGGRVEKIQVGDQVLTGRDIRELFGLRSADFTFAFDGKDRILFTTDGYGHGVGMSQWGANGMAQAGFGYEEILKHYYTGVTIAQ